MAAVPLNLGSLSPESQADMRKILGENTLRLQSEVERIAQQMK